MGLEDETCPDGTLDETLHFLLPRVDPFFKVRAARSLHWFNLLDGEHGAATLKRVFSGRHELTLIKVNLLASPESETQSLVLDNFGRPVQVLLLLLLLQWAFRPLRCPMNASS